MAEPKRKDDAADLKPMDQADQQTAFQLELDRLIHRYRLEYGMTLASFVGTLEVVKSNLLNEVTRKRVSDLEEAFYAGDEDEDDDGEEIS
jgi:hypothetical protein